MSATILLVRHAAHADVGRRLSGRLPGLSLADAGRSQAAALARAFAHDPPDIVQASPRERAQETAAAIAPGRAVITAAALDELDFGEWTGRDFAELETDPRWRAWNERRGSARVPGGESMAEAADRAHAHLAAAAAQHRGARIVMVSHSDVIRGVVARVLGLPLDHLLRFDVDPASITTIVAGSWGERLVALNERVRA